MIKKILLVMLIMFTAGCVNINTLDIDEILKSAVTSEMDIDNTYRTGYKFYLPRGCYIQSTKEYNEVIKSKDNTLYMFIDIIGYLNKSKLDYKKDNKKYFSQTINYKNKNGYVEINKIKDKYLVEIVYNYAKIEVMVNEKSINQVLTDGIIILSSISYNDKILKNISNSNILNYNETPVDIFPSNKNDNSNLLEYKENYDEEIDEDIIPDYDTIN